MTVKRKVTCYCNVYQVAGVTFTGGCYAYKSLAEQAGRNASNPTKPTYLIRVYLKEKRR